MFGRKKGESITLDEPGRVMIMDSAYYKELIAAKNELVVLRNEKEDWLEDRAGVIEKQNDLNAEIERLREEIHSLRSATFHEVPEKPKRTWSVVYGWGKRKTEDLVKAQNYTLNEKDVYQFWNEVRTGKVRLSQNYAGVSELVYERERVVVAEYSTVVSVVEVCE